MNLGYIPILPNIRGSYLGETPQLQLHWLLMKSHFRNHLLVAMPTLVNEFFSKAVVYIYEHSEQSGAIGFTLNKPLSATVGNVLEHLTIKVQDNTVIDQPVFSGGPVGPDQGFGLQGRIALA